MSPSADTRKPTRGAHSNDVSSVGGATFDRYELAEYDDRVEIGVVEEAPNGFRTDDYEERTPP